VKLTIRVSIWHAVCRSVLFVLLTNGRREQKPFLRCFLVTDNLLTGRQGRGGGVPPDSGSNGRWQNTERHCFLRHLYKIIDTTKPYTSLYTMKAYGSISSRGISPLILNLGTRCRGLLNVSASLPRDRAGLDVLGKSIIHCPYRDSNLGLSSM
jgi:hypothetical protein